MEGYGMNSNIKQRLFTRMKNYAQTEVFHIPKQMHNHWQTEAKTWSALQQPLRHALTDTYVFVAFCFSSLIPILLCLFLDSFISFSISSFVYPFIRIFLSLYTFACLSFFLDMRRFYEFQKISYKVSFLFCWLWCTQHATGVAVVLHHTHKFRC
jgi:uncharacterized protein YqhQ